MIQEDQNFIKVVSMHKVIVYTEYVACYESGKTISQGQKICSSKVSTISGVFASSFLMSHLLLLSSIFLVQ